MIEETIDARADQRVRPATPAGRGDNGAPPWLDHATLARYTHFGRLPLHAMVGLDPELALVLDAHFVGCAPERLREIRRDHESTVLSTAAALLTEPEFTTRLAQLTAVTGPRIVVLGDSITADSLGWANLLAACLEGSSRAVGVAGTTVCNLAVSGFTSSETIPLFDLVVRERPTSVLSMLGTNDGRRQGPAADVRTVSATETQRNLLALKKLTEVDAGARFVAIGPPPMDQARFDAATPAGSPTRFSSTDLAETLAVIRAALPDVIDVSALLGSPVPAGFWLPDGVHPTIEGQQALLRHIVRTAARLALDA